MPSNYKKTKYSTTQGNKKSNLENFICIADFTVCTIMICVC